jgi:hypothetical protein
MQKKSRIHGLCFDFFVVCMTTILRFVIAANMPVPVAARSAAIVGSNPTGGMEVRVLCVVR